MEKKFNNKLRLLLLTFVVVLPFILSNPASAFKTIAEGSESPAHVVSKKIPVQTPAQAPVVSPSLSASAVTPKASESAVAKSQKERIVLMPLRLDDDLKKLQGSMEASLINGLQQKYIVFAGEQVTTKARQIFNKESVSKKKECDETKCLQDIAIAFQAELLAVANITKQDGGYFLSLTIQNIFDNKIEYSRSFPCRDCDSFQVVSKLSEFFDPTTKSSSEEDEITDWLITKNTHTEMEYKAFLKRHPKTLLALQVADKIWPFIEKENTISGYQNFIQSYPKSTFIPRAKVNLDLLQWNLALSEDTVDSYTKFIHKNPDSPFIGKALEKLKEATLSLYKPKGFYLGLLAGKPSAISGVDQDMSRGGLLGYNFTKSLSLELGATQLYSKANADMMAASIIPGREGFFSITSATVSVKYAYLLTDAFNIAANMGVHKSAILLEGSGGGILSDTSSNGLVYGLKAQYDFNKFVAIRAGFDIYRISSGLLNGTLANTGAALMLKF